MGVLHASHRQVILPVGLAGIAGVLVAAYLRRRCERHAEAEAELGDQAEHEQCEQCENDLDWPLLDVLGLILKDLGLEAACRCRLICKGAQEAVGLKAMQLAAEDSDWIAAQLQETGLLLRNLN